MWKKSFFCILKLNKESDPELDPDPEPDPEPDPDPLVRGTGSGDSDPDPQKYVTDPQHWTEFNKSWKSIVQIHENP